MKVFGNENLPPEIIDWLRTTGHDVTYARESTRGTDDVTWLRLAAAEKRVILTNDLDFGDLVFRRRFETAGVVQLRLYHTRPSLLLAALIPHWPAIEAAGPGQFVTVTEQKLRIRPIE